MNKYQDIGIWDMLTKRLLWEHLEFLKGSRILDFGSGYGVTADYLAANNQVTAVEPSAEMAAHTMKENDYLQLQGSQEILEQFPEHCFDAVICHNVLEYIEDKENAVKEFCRVLKPGGYFSLVKHNRVGRVMQMVVLLNNFEHAHELLDGENGVSPQYGNIRYYVDEDVTKWCTDLKLVKSYGLRTFWDLQQNQEMQGDKDWQEKMLEVERRVSQIDEYFGVAFLHHLIYRVN